MVIGTVYHPTTKYKVECIHYSCGKLSVVTYRKGKTPGFMIPRVCAHCGAGRRLKVVEVVEDGKVRRKR